MAARLAVSCLPRFHVLDMLGVPCCMPIDRPPIYAVDHDNQLSAAFVPEELRCHRAGCAERWPRRVLS